MFGVKSVWYGENGKVSVVKKRKRKRIQGRLGSKLAQLPFPGNGARKLVGYFKRKQKNPQAHGYRSPATAPESLLGILNANEKIRKRTDTDVAFTREYSRVSIFHRERECTN